MGEHDGDTVSIFSLFGKMSQIQTGHKPYKVPPQYQANGLEGGIAAEGGGRGHCNASSYKVVQWPQNYSGFLYFLLHFMFQRRGLRSIEFECSCDLFISGCS